MSSTNSTHEFPSPVGGVPFSLDFGPSILFSALYGLLVPIAVWRMVHDPRSRNAVLFGTTIFSIERVVACALRAKVAHDASLRQSVGLETYFQITFSNGFITIGQNLVILTRALLVHATLGSNMLSKDQSTEHRRDAESDTQVPPTARPGGRDGIPKYAFAVDAGLEDHPRMRFWVRRGCEAAIILFLVVVVLSAVAGADYKNAIKSGAHASLVQHFRHANAALTLVLLVGLAIGAVWARVKLPRVPKRPVMWIVVLAFLLSIICIYRLVVMRFYTTSLISDAPGSLNSSQSKATFYVFHVLPEFIAFAILMCLDVRRTFATGMWGDMRSADLKPKAEIK